MTERLLRVTDLELRILQQLWQSEAGLTVHDIVDDWGEGSKPGYTTVLKTLQKMEAKALVDHEALGRKYTYRARVPRQQVVQGRLRSLIDHVFLGDKLSFAQYFIAEGGLDADELAKLKLLIERSERGRS